MKRHVPYLLDEPNSLILEQDDEELDIDSRIYDYYLSLVLPAGL